MQQSQSFKIRDCVGFSCRNTRLPSLPSVCRHGMVCPKFPPGAELLARLCCCVTEAALHSSPPKRACDELITVLQSALSGSYRTGTLHTSCKTNPVKFKTKDMTKTVLTVPHTVEQKIQWLERKPQNHTTIVKPISFSLPLEKQSLCVLVAAGLSSDRNRCLAVPGDTECWILNQHKTDSTTSWESNVHACSSRTSNMYNLNPTGGKFQVYFVILNPGKEFLVWVWTTLC